MDEARSEQNRFGAQRISRVLLRIAPPVMLAQLIQALYNIVDSFFVGRYSAGALTNVVFDPLLRLFSNSAQVRQIGLTAFLIIGCSFFSAVFSRMLPVLFQAGSGLCLAGLPHCRDGYGGRRPGPLPARAAPLAQRGAGPCRFLGCTTGCAREYTYPSAESMRCSEVKNRT